MLTDLRSCADSLQKRADQLWKHLDVEAKQRQLQKWDAQISQPDFWDQPEAARKVVAAASHLKKSVETLIDYRKHLEELEVMLELLSESQGDEATTYKKEVAATLATLTKTLEALELEAFLGGPHDACNAIMSIHAGAGGTESCDWAEMLLRLYTRWGERRGYTVTIQDLQSGEEAGISSVTFSIQGDKAYGYAKAERGVHRLVRISPFDANSRRHTSFCSIDVIAEIDEDISIEIKDEDLRIDTFRASGKGGQHVNKTDSAVRITHLPTHTVVSCQNERSQLKNRTTALKVLKARLYESLQDEKRAEREKFYGEKGEIAWGNQIRSYVFQPYQMVKDLRTGCETGNVQAVMDGDIDTFIHTWLRAGCPSVRR